jgi:hypothetical protein
MRCVYFVGGEVLIQVCYIYLWLRAGVMRNTVETAWCVVLADLRGCAKGV